MKSPRRLLHPFEPAKMALALALVLVAPPVVAQQTWAQRALLRDDLAGWPAEAAPHAGVGAFDQAAEALERVADQTPEGDAAFALRERAMKVRLALGDEAGAARDLERTVAPARRGPEAASRVWRLVELLGAACEHPGDVDWTAQNTRLRRCEGLYRTWLRRCEGLYRTWLRRLGLRPPLDVRVRARVALARPVPSPSQEVHSAAGPRLGLVAGGARLCLLGCALSDAGT